MNERTVASSLPNHPDSEEIASSFGGKATQAIAVSSIGFAVALIGSVFVARLLGTEGKGSFSLFLTTVTGLTMFAGLGIEKGQMYHASRSPKKLDLMLPNGLVVALLLGGAIGLSYFLFGHSTGFRIASMGRTATFAGILIVPILIMINVQKQYLVSTHYYTFSRALFAVQQALPLLAAIALYPLHHVTVSGLIGAVTVGMMTLLLSAHILMRVYLPYSISLSVKRFSIPFLRESLQFGIREYLSNVTLFLTNRLDFFLVAWFLGRSDLGVYSVAVAVGEMVVRIPGELGVILFPIFASGILKKGQAASFLRRISIIAMVLAVALAIVSTPLILFLFGSEFSESSKVLRWLLPGTIAWSTVQVTWNRVSGGGRPGLGVPVFGAAALLNGGLNVLLLPKVGVVGAAMASSASYLFAASVFLWLFCRREECSFSEAVFVRSQDFRAIAGTLVALLRVKDRRASGGIG